MLPAIALAAALSVVTVAAGSSARSELQLEFGDLLFEDERYWEAIPAYTRAKDDAKPEQLVRASSGVLRSALLLAEFNRVYVEAQYLQALDPQDPEIRALTGDGFWAFGLFEEAEAIYQDVLAVAPSSPGARHGLARSLASQGRGQDALTEIRAALTFDPDSPTLYHALGSILRRLNRYAEAAEAYEQFVERIPNVRQGEKTDWARSQIRFLRSFGDRVPVELVGGEDVVHTIPFRLVNDKVVVRARINDHDAVDLVVDTGAEQMVLSQETAQAGQVRPITQTVSAGVGDVGLRGLDLARVDTLQIENFEIRNVPAIIKNPPLTGLPSRRVPDSVSPLALGMSAVIDYGNRRLVLAKTLPYEPADIELPMRVDRLAMVRGVVNGQPKSFVVDTGGEVISISLGTASQIDTAPVRHIPLLVFGTSGWDQEAFLLPGVNLSFAEIEYENFSVVVLNLHRPSALLGFHIGGIVGHKFLSNYVVTMDLTRSLLRLRKL